MSDSNRDITADALHWVNTELATTLTQANRSLEQFEQNEDNRDALREVAQLLHTAHGALRMVEVHGAVLLAEEMVNVARALHERKIPNQQEGLEALSRALVQLPTYLERVAGGGRDVPLILLPLLNDLRAVRGNALLSESSLFILNANRDGNLPVRARTHSKTDIRALAQQMRPQYQTSLLHWLRGSNPRERLQTLIQVAQKFEDAATSAAVYQVWWVIGGILEAIVDGGLRPSASVKRLLGQGDRQIKALAAHGESSAAANAPGGLLNNLLFYVGRASSEGPKVTAIKQAFNLEELLEPIAQYDQDHALLNAPSVNLMKTVAAAIRQDLNQVKDAIDIFVRTDSKDRSGLADQVTGLRKIADTLGVLGLAQLREQIAEQSNILQGFVDGQADVTGALMPIAASLIACETALDHQLVSKIVPGDPNAEPASAAQIAADSDRRDVVEAVLRECVVNLGRVKEALSQFVEHPQSGAVLDPVAGLLNGIMAGLVMLEKTRAKETVSAINWHIAQLRSNGVNSLSAHELDRLADAMVSVEYFMDTVQKGRSDPEYMLDNAQTCLAELSRQPPRPGAQAAAPAPAQAAAVRDTGTASRASARQIADLDKAIVADGRAQVDPQLLELFIEEAKEEVATLNRNLPRWTSAPENRELILSIRRAFHTLKGSGRMVGARVIAEFSWALEELLNASITEDVTDTNGLIDVLNDGVKVLPELVEQLEIGTPLRTDINAIVARAQALFRAPEPRVQETEEADDAAAGALASVSAAQPVAPEATVTLDPVLYDIFRKETQGHLAVIDTYINDKRGEPPPYRVDDSLHRAWHTLSGSANMAAVAHVVDVTRPMNEFLRAALNDSGLMSAEALTTMARASATIDQIVQRINSAQQLPEITQLCASIGALEHVRSESRDSSGDTAQDTSVEQLSYDPEIAAIFAEEAHELLAASDTVLAAWLADREPEQSMAELLRHLHTLKGGARMAGVQSMATLSHELETLFERINNQELALTDAGRSALRHGFDRLHAIQESLAAQAAPGDAEEVIAEIHALYREEQAPAPADAPTPAPVAEDVADTASGDDEIAGEEIEAGEIEAEEIEAEEIEAGEIEAGEIEAGEIAGEEVASEFDEIFEAPRVAAPAAGASADAVGATEQDPAPEHISYAEVASVAQDMAELVEELRDVSDNAASIPPLPPAASTVRQSDDEFALRLAQATQGPRPAAAFAPAMPAPGSSDKRPDYARIDARMLDDMLNNAGEVSIFHSRMEQEVSSIAFNLTELSQTVVRLREQLRKLDSETEAQIRYRHQDEAEQGDEFDPLELDRYSSIQQLSRALGESVSDLVSIQELLNELTRESESLLVQQSRVTTELQDALIRTRMLPFSNFTPRLERVVRGAARDAGKQVNLTFTGESGELDRQVLQRMMSPFEHMLRNAVVHGIEQPSRRRELGKPPAGQIDVTLHREGAEMVIRVKDDGAGLDLESIKAVARERGLIDEHTVLGTNDTLNLILQPGFSTAAEVTHEAGRGVGMDVVANEVKRLGGSFAVESRSGIGTVFIARLPLTLAVTQALLVRCGREQFAIPLPAVEGIVRVPRGEVEAFLRDPQARYVYGSQEYRFAHLGRYVGTPAEPLEGSPAQAVPVVLVRAGEHSTALLMDEMLGSREVVVKAVGPLVSAIPGIAGATILGDGSIVVILDVATLVRRAETLVPLLPVSHDASDERPLIMVVDDSITVRRVTQRLLERNDMRVLTAKDGVDAVALMQESTPDLILLDIEMPRMDGYEVTTHIRNSSHLKHLPIIMVTSRTGDKHRTRAFELGVDGYLGKPYQESQLLEAVGPLLAAERLRQQQG